MSSEMPCHNIKGVNCIIACMAYIVCTYIVYTTYMTNAPKGIGAI